MGLTFRPAIRGDLAAELDEILDRLNDANGDAVERWGLDLKQALRAQLATVTSPGRNRGRGQNLAKTWSSRFYGNRRALARLAALGKRGPVYGSLDNPATLVYSTAPAIVELLAEGGTVHPRQARYLVVTLPAGVALGLDRLLGDRGGGLRLRKASDLASALATLGRLHRIPRPDGSIVLALERGQFRRGGGRGRFARRGTQLVPIFLLTKRLTFRRKIDPDGLARRFVDRFPAYLADAMDRAGVE